MRPNVKFPYILINLRKKEKPPNRPKIVEIVSAHAELAASKVAQILVTVSRFVRHKCIILLYLD